MSTSADTCVSTEVVPQKRKVGRPKKIDDMVAYQKEYHARMRAEKGDQYKATQVWQKKRNHDSRVAYKLLRDICKNNFQVSGEMREKVESLYKKDNTTDSPEHSD